MSASAYSFRRRQEKEVRELWPVRNKPRHRHAGHDALPRERLHDRLGGLRQLDREFVEEGAVQHLNTLHLRDRLGELARTGMVRFGKLAKSRLAEQRHVRGEGEAAEAGIGADVGGRLLAADMLLAG